MSIQTDLSVSPYFDDYNEESDFYKILFRPGVSVQARELNQLQTILQKQISRFGDNIFKTGTIISGCDIVFHNDLNYAKIKDIETDSTPVVVSNYKGYRVKNQNNIVPLTAAIIATDSGFESRKPDLNTLYLRYLNSGLDTSTANSISTFQAGETLTVFNPLNVIEKITVTNASQNFLDTDRVIILSAIAIQNANNGKTFSTSLNSGDYITNGTANVQIIAAPDSNTLSDALILQIKPRKEDLANNNSKGWTFNVGDSIQKVGTSGEVIKISQIIGSGASAVLKTDNLSQAKTISMVSKGSDYFIIPSVSISSTTASVNDINLFSATAQNYLTKVTIDSTDSPTGSTYGMTVGDGVIYQKGYFSRVSEQLLIVEKYNNTPDQKSVGFQTNESIVTSNQDASLLDNALGTPNYTAPGANRLKLEPQLVVIDKTKTDVPDDFLYIAEFSEGLPYKQNRQTVYNIIGKEIAQRSFEQAGDYVLDPFLVNTKSPDSFADELTKFNVMIDPGTAFINGKKIQTVYNYEQSVDKATDSITATGSTISMNYGNFVYVNELGGIFDFNKGVLVSLYNTPTQYLTKGRSSFTPAGGSVIGTARIRSIIQDSGVPGAPSGVYRVYLFDIRMNPGSNFRNVRSIYYSGGSKAVCDLVLENGIAALKDTSASSLIFYAGQDAIKKISNISYTYRTNSTATLATTGVATISPPIGTTFPYANATLSSTQERDFTIIPTSDAVSSVNLSGTVTTSSTSNAVVGSSTTFTQDLLTGDYIRFADGTVKQVSLIGNNTFLQLTSNASVSLTNNTYAIHFPANVAISFARSNRTISLISGSLSINVGTTISSSTPINVTYNVKSGTVSPVTKTVNRSKYVRLQLANNASSNTGPWALGVSDAFRLNKVFKGPNATFTDTASANVFDVTNDYYIDHNQNEDYYGISYLYKKPNTPSTLTTGDYLLVSFDYISVAGPGVKIFANSSIIDDSVPLSSTSGKMNTLEIPEVYGVTGTYYDLRDQIDLRPQTNNSVTPGANSSLAPINPIEPSAANIISSPPTDYFFPAPDSIMTADVEYYLPRSDRVVVDDTNEFRVIKGTPGTSIAPAAPDNSLTLNILKIPPYPSIPYTLSANTTKFTDNGIANEKYTTRRIRNYRITTTLSDNDISVLQPRNYTMSEISKLENRISTLEYYTSLSLVETLTQKRNIPSAIDSNVDRYKFGFYVDGFEDYTHADISNPGYRAAIVDGYLSPAVTEFNINTSTPSSDVSLPYIETSFISQKKATDGPVATTVVRNPTTTQSKVCVIQAQRSISASDNAPYVYDEFFYTFGSASDTFDFYMVSPYGKTAAEVYQSSSPVGPWTLVTSSQYAQPITSIDVAQNKLDSIGNVLHPGTLNILGPGPVAGGWIGDQYKLSASHNPINGLYYKVRVYKGVFYLNTNIYTTGSFGTIFNYKMCYPTNAEVNVINNKDTTNYQMSYGGHIKSLYGGPAERERFVVRNV